MRRVVLLPPLYSWGNWGTKRSSNSPQDSVTAVLLQKWYLAILSPGDSLPELFIALKNYPKTWWLQTTILLNVMILWVSAPLGDSLFNLGSNAFKQDGFGWGPTDLEGPWDFITALGRDSWKAGFCWAPFPFPVALGLSVWSLSRMAQRSEWPRQKWSVHLKMRSRTGTTWLLQAQASLDIRTRKTGPASW